MHQLTINTTGRFIFVNQSKAFLVSFVCAIGAMALVYLWVEEQRKEFDKQYGTKQAVVVAKVDINEFEEITQEKLTVISVPAEFRQPGAQQDISAFEGTVANAPIKEGEQVLSTKVLEKGAETGLASQVAISLRAISIPVSPITGVTKLLKPGDRVDIIAAVPYQTDKGQESEVKTIMQNVHVLAVGQYIQNQIPQIFRADGITGESTAVNLRGEDYGTVSIEVDPLQTQSIIFTLQSGADLFLSLRNPVDRAVVTVPTTTVDEVLGPESKRAKSLAKKIAPPQVRKAPKRARKPAKVSKPKPLPAPKDPWIDGGGDL